MVLPPGGFKPPASANSATRALPAGYWTALRREGCHALTLGAGGEKDDDVGDVARLPDPPERGFLFDEPASARLLQLT